MILQFSELNDRALVYTMNKNADKTHPCGAPVFIVMVEDISHSVRTWNVPFRCRFTYHELLTAITDSDMVRSEPFLYRLKRGQIPQSVKLHLSQMYTDPLSYAERPDYLPDCIAIVHTTSRRDYLGGGD